MTKGRAQDKALLNMIADNEVSTSLNMSKEALSRILKKVQEETRDILGENRMAGLK